MNRRDFLKNSLGLISLLSLGNLKSFSEAQSFALPQKNRWLHTKPGNSFGFFAIGDMGTGWKSQYQLIEQMELITQKQGQTIDSVLLLGDIIYPSPSENKLVIDKFEKPFTPLIDKGLHFYPAWGNHDWVAEKAQILKSYFGAPNYYTFINGAAQFWSINSNEFNQVQLSWLRNSLSISNSPWKVIFLHHSPYSSGKVHHNNKHLVKYLCPVLNEFGVDLCLSGHNHIYERSEKIGSTIYITSGGGSASLHKYDEEANFPRAKVNSTNHFLAATGDYKHLNLKAIDKSGNTIDNINLTKSF